MKNKWYLLIGLVSINALNAMQTVKIALYDRTNKPEISSSVLSPIPSPRRACPSPDGIKRMRKRYNKIKKNPERSGECSKLLIQLCRLQKECVE